MIRHDDEPVAYIEPNTFRHWRFGVAAAIFISCVIFVLMYLGFSGEKTESSELADVSADATRVEPSLVTANPRMEACRHYPETTRIETNEPFVDPKKKIASENPATISPLRKSGSVEINREIVNLSKFERELDKFLKD